MDRLQVGKFKLPGKTLTIPLHLKIPEKIMRNSWYVNSSFNLVQMYAGKYIYSLLH